MPGDHSQPLLLRIALDLDFATVGQLAHDVVQQMGRHRNSTRLLDVGRDLLDYFTLKVGGFEMQHAARRLEEDVRQNRDCGAALDNASDVAESPQQFTAFNNELHGP